MMAPLTPSYQYQEDQVFAVFEGHIIASGTEFAKVAETAEEYLNSLSTSRENTAEKKARKDATHIETPNGLKGEIISRTSAVWGDEITVRFENNQIRHFQTTAGLKFTKETAAQPSNYREALQTVLDRAVEPTREGLTTRLAELDSIRQDASQHIAGESKLSEQHGLHRIVMAAEAETEEVKEVLAHLDAVDAENATPAPPVYAATEQADMGRGGTDSWLDVTAAEMIAESEAVDLDKLMEEGPTTLVSSLDQVHDTGSVREIAQAHVLAKTAGFTGPEVEKYREAFVAKTETARRRELTYRLGRRKQEATVKEAATAGVPDEALFF